MGGFLRRSTRCSFLRRSESMTKSSVGREDLGRCWPLEPRKRIYAAARITLDLLAVLVSLVRRIIGRVDNKVSKQKKSADGTATNAARCAYSKHIFYRTKDKFHMTSMSNGKR